MGFRCVNCGGNILFDVKTQSMKCQHCGSMISPEEFEVKNSSTGEDIEEMGLTLFTCSGCGAQLQGTEDSQVGFCPFCGGQNLLRASNGGRSLPDRLIPFQVTKDDCAELFQDYTQKVRYLPKELRNAAHLKNFTGIYMPYYEYDVELGATKIVGTKVVESTPKYDVVNTYSIDAKVEGNYCGVPYDASKYYDDEIAARVLPFDMKKERPFRPAYLSGFYADASTVSSDTYYEDAALTASKDILDEVGYRLRRQEGISVEKESSQVEAHTRGCHSTMFPLWFLTWRKDKRVAYAVVNGDSGKVVTDLPVDLKAFSRGCLVIGAILFLVLELLFQPTPLITSMVSLVVGGLMAGSIRSSTKRIFERQNHINDKGWNPGNKPSIQKESTVKKKHISFFGLDMFNIPFFLLIGLVYAFRVSGAFGMALTSRVLAAGVPIYLILSTVKVLKWQKTVPQRQPSLAIIPVLAAVAINAAIVFISPVNDLWYYLGDAVSILIMIIASFFMLQVYNIGTTRPLPRLFDREEVR